MISLPGYDAWRLAEPPMAPEEPEEPEEEHIVELHVWVRVECGRSDAADTAYDVSKAVEQALNRHMNELDWVTAIEDVTLGEVELA